MTRNPLVWFVSALVILVPIVFTTLTTCPDTSSADYDFIVIGAGAGGGPLAARLAESGFSGMVDLML